MDPYRAALAPKLATGPVRTNAPLAPIRLRGLCAVNPQAPAATAFPAGPATLSRGLRRLGTELLVAGIRSDEVFECLDEPLTCFADGGDTNDVPSALM